MGVGVGGEAGPVIGAGGANGHKGGDNKGLKTGKIMIS